MTVEDRDRAGRTPLHYAVKHSRHDLQYIAAQTDSALAADNLRKNNEFKIANTTELLDQGANVNVADDGYTPLHFAAADDSVGVVELLLAAGADIEAADDKGETPLYKAVRNTTEGAVPITRLLLERGADPQAPLINGSSPLSFVKRYGEPEMRELFSGL